ncbi:MAG TPA: hypothetical protein PKA27_01700 [Fimbriimonadaceae bacterium]|nr:hypothetical protein [Fimbriimonadaceae bacterium]
MRIKNKELRARRHRKEQRVKEILKEQKAMFAGGSKPAADKPAKTAAPKAEAKPKKAPAAKKAVADADKPKKAPAKKKTEAPSE